MADMRPTFDGFGCLVLEAGCAPLTPCGGTALYYRARLCSNGEYAPGPDDNGVWINISDAPSGSFIITGYPETCMYIDTGDTPSDDPGTVYGLAELTVYFDCNTCANETPDPCLDVCCQRYAIFPVYVDPNIEVDEFGNFTNADPSAYKISGVDDLRACAYDPFLSQDRTTGKWTLTYTYYQPVLGEDVTITAESIAGSECPPFQEDDLLGQTWVITSRDPSDAPVRLTQVLCRESDTPFPLPPDLPSVITVTNLIGNFTIIGATSTPAYAVWDGTLTWDGTVNAWVTPGYTTGSAGISVLTSDGKYWNNTNGIARSVYGFFSTGSQVWWKSVDFNWYTPAVLYQTQSELTSGPLYVYFGVP